MPAPLFTYQGTISLKSSDNVELTRQLLSQPGNAKLLLDNTLAAGVSTLDLAPLLAPILDPQWLVILFGGAGAKINLDGLGGSAKAFKAIAFQVTPNSPGPSGVLDIEIDVPALVLAQRIQVFAIGL